MIGGKVAIVPLLIVPLVIVVAAGVQPLIKKYSTEVTGYQKGKMSTLLELLNNLETVRTVAGGGFLKKRWKETIEGTSKTLIKARTFNNIATTFSQSSLQISSTGIVVVGVILVSNQSLPLVLLLLVLFCPVEFYHLLSKLALY